MTRAVVVGSGIGGSAATLLLAHAGIQTTLVEKNRRIGGSCSGYDKTGFHIDIGTHMFCRGNRGPLGDVLRRANEDGAIRFVRTRDIAEQLHLSPKTVDVHRTHLKEKLELKDATALIRHAVRWVETQGGQV